MPTQTAHWQLGVDEDDYCYATMCTCAVGAEHDEDGTPVTDDDKPRSLTIPEIVAGAFPGTNIPRTVPATGPHPVYLWHVHHGSTEPRAIRATHVEVDEDGDVWFLDGNDNSLFVYYVPKSHAAPVQRVAKVSNGKD
jgi:hypothetical protein